MMSDSNLIQQLSPLLFGVELSLYVLLVVSGLAGLTVFLSRLSQIRKARGDSSRWIEVLKQDLEHGVLPESLQALADKTSLPGRMIHVGIENAGLAPDALEKAFEVQELSEKRTLEHGVAFLGTLGSNAPFVGLTGTVLGILIAFNEFAQSGGQGSTEVMSAIARSLVATTLGLLVAIPAVIAYNVLKSQIKVVLDNGREVQGLILVRSLHASCRAG